MRTFWTQAEIETAVTMRAAGKSFAEIAAALGRSRAGVAQQMFKRGIVMSDDHRRQLYQGNLERIRLDPEVQQRRRAAMSAAYTPERRQQSSDRARQLRIWEKGKAAQSIEDKREAIAKANKIWSKMRCGWCPPHLRADYDTLTGGGRERMTAAEARVIVEAQWLGQLRRALRQIAEVAPRAIAEHERHRRSFAGQMERVAAGARVVPALHMSRSVSNDRSLTGNATGMCAA